MNAAQMFVRKILWAIFGLAICTSSAAATERVTLYLTNALGTPIAEMDAAGNVTYTAANRPYGKQQIGAPQSGPGFTGHINDPVTGFVYMQQRYYDPSSGRFLSSDPVPVYNDSMGAFNRYWYAGNNPYTFIDPDGRAKKVAWLIKLTAKGMRKVARLTREEAVRARHAQKNILGDRRQVSNGIEKAAFGEKGKLKHAAHELKDGAGSKGLSHYQTKGKRGHSFWGKISVTAAATADALDKVAEAAEYLPEPGVRPATQDDIDRANNIIDKVNEITGSGVPHYPDIPEKTPPPPKPIGRVTYPTLE